jgi:Polyketide cyclase / dehydrase and lipid transport
MPNAHVMEQSRVIPVDVDVAFDGTLPMPLPTLFSRWYGPISPIKAVRDQSGDWRSAGQTRTVVQVGGGSMRETLTGVQPPHMFGYTLSEIRGALAPLVDHIDGQWLFAPVSTGTRVTWRWSVHPRSAAAGLAMPAFAKLWRGFAKQSLERLCHELVR